MPLFWMYLHGYGGHTLIGTSTAKIGDPTGRTESRPDMTSATLVQNMTVIHQQLKALWTSTEETGQRFGYKRDWAWERAIHNNNTWWNKRSLLGVLKRLGGSVRIGPMLGRDHVKTRLEDGSGMSLAEFIYPVMQGWDWWELYKQRGVQMQIGGSDQYGNILMGAECVKTCIKKETDPEFQLPVGGLNEIIGFTVPLLTDASGAKFGKSAGNAIWLDPFRTSPYDMWGYFMRRRDDDVERLLMMLTFLPQSKIKEVMKSHELDQRQRVAQRLLAREVVRFVHGKGVAGRTETEHRAMYSAKTATVPAASASAAQSPEQYQTPEGQQVSILNRPRVRMQLPWSVFDMSMARILYACGLATSVGDGDRSIKAGGVYLGGSPEGAKGMSYLRSMNPQQLQFTPIRAWEPATNKRFLIEEKLLLIRKGKHNLRCIEFIPDKEFARLGVTYRGQHNTGRFRAALDKIRNQREAAKAKQEQSATGELPEEDRLPDPLWNFETETMGKRPAKWLGSNVKEMEKAGLVKARGPMEW